MSFKRFLGLLLLFDFLIVFARVFYTEAFTYAFLIWNLFLALVPFAISSGVSRRKWPGLSKLFLLPLGALWLFFLPNAPYILSDFYHLRTLTNSHSVWFDAWMLFTYSFTGLVLFYASLLQASQFWKNVFKRGTGVFVLAVIFLTCLAVYLGRTLRFNSWDVLLAPLEIAHAFYNAFSSGTFWRLFIPNFVFLTVGFGLLLSLKKTAP